MADLMAHDNARAFEYINSRSGLIHVADFIGIVNLRDDRVVAAFGYDHHQELSCFMHIASEAGGLTRRFVAKAFEVPYVQWGYNVTMGVIQGSNLPSRLVAARLGYAEMLVIPDAHPSGALHLMAMYKKNCPWLPGNKKNVRRLQGTECTVDDGQRLDGQ